LNGQVCVAGHLKPAFMKGFHRTDLHVRRCLHWAAFFEKGRTCLRSFGCNTRSSSNYLQHGTRAASAAPCVQPKRWFVWPWLHHSAEFSSVVARIMHVTGCRAKLLRRIWKNNVLDMVNMRLLAGTRVNSRHLATLHGHLLNYQLQRPCSACDCTQVGSSDNDIGCQERFSLRKGLNLCPDEQSKLERIWCMHHKQD